MATPIVRTIANGTTLEVATAAPHIPFVVNPRPVVEVTEDGPNRPASVVDYTLAAIQQACINWHILEMGESPALIHIKVDIENATRRLPAHEQAIVAKVQERGQMAFEADPNDPSYVPVVYPAWQTVTRRLFGVLNREGTF